MKGRAGIFVIIMAKGPHLFSFEADPHFEKEDYSERKSVY